ncbi:MAG: hypothetical protein HY744_01340 [Deltaproteobacteria bacterium]|nr:hypothetical protein [Deltaproteobacteria bacterium]
MKLGSLGGLGATLLALALTGGDARAQGARQAGPAPASLPQRRAKLSIEQDWVALSVSWRDVADGAVRSKLLSGLPTVIAARAYLFPEGSDRPVALTAKTCRIAYDLWDEIFLIDLRQGGVRRRTVAVNVEGVLRRCGEARGLPLVSAASLEPLPRRYFVGVLVEVNPLDKTVLDRIKRWVALPRGAGSVGPGDSLFGSFVGLFVTQVPEADTTLRFRTQSFGAVELARGQQEK